MLSIFYQRYQFTLQKSRTALSLIPSRADVRVPLDRNRLRRKGDGEKRKVYSYAVRNAIHDDPPIFLKEGKYSDSLYKAGKHFLHRIGTFKHDLFSDRITVFNRSSVLKRCAFHVLKPKYRPLDLQVTISRVLLRVLVNKRQPWNLQTSYPEVVFLPSVLPVYFLIFCFSYVPLQSGQETK